MTETARSRTAEVIRRNVASREDLELACRLAERDEEALRILVERYHGSLLRLALAFVADRTAAEEVVQDTWLGVINGVRKFEGRSTLKGWIFSILINRAKTRGVRDKRSVQSLSFVGSDIYDDPAVEPSRFTPSGRWADPPKPWDTDSPQDLLMRKEIGAVVERAVADLPPNQRTVLTLRDIEGFESNEVSNLLEISEANQRVLLHRARPKVRQALERHLTLKRLDAEPGRTTAAHL